MAVDITNASMDAAWNNAKAMHVTGFPYWLYSEVIR